MIKGILEEFFAVVFILIVLWLGTRMILNLYKKLLDVNKTEDKK